MVISKKKHLKCISFFLFITIIFLNGCANQKSNNTFSLTKKEKKYLKAFFRKCLFDNSGIYTLFGTKPVSTVLIQQLPEEEKKELHLYYKSLFKGKKRNFFKARYNFFKNYQKWETIRPRFKITQYLFGKFAYNEENQALIFVNIEETIKTLIKHYETFKRVLGYDFDPFEIVFEVENKDSKFWKEIVLNRKHALLGILFGYGEDNAWFFDYNMKYINADGRIGEFFRTFPTLIYLSDKNTICYSDPQHFNLPIFRRFGENPGDKKLIKKYQKEQKMIKAIYKGRDEVEVTLERLTR